jgi:lysophospholipase L1-like esterase
MMRQNTILMLLLVTVFAVAGSSAFAAKQRVACIGNSITAGFGLSHPESDSYPAVLQQLLGNDYEVGNFGVSARTLLNKGDLPYMKEPAWRKARQMNPDIVVVKLGTNDSKPENWQYGEGYESDMQLLVDSLKALGSNPRILLCTPIPAFKPTWNINDSVITHCIIPAIERVAQRNGCEIIDLHTLYAAYGGLMQADGIHPAKEGARKIAELVCTALRQEKCKGKCCVMCKDKK